jgi:hypothetical protein
MLPTWIASVDPVWFAIIVGTLAALAFLAIALLAWGGRLQAREIARLQVSLNETRHEQSVLTGDTILTAAELDEVKDDLRKQTLRIDRMQRDDKRRGWSDSLDLTRFNWKKPDPF